MKFLLCAVNAKFIHSNPAVYSLQASADEALRSHVEIAEYTINQHPDDILADIYNKKPDVIGFSCYIWNRTVVQGLLCELPKILPGVDIWLGGPEVTFDAPEILAQYPQVTGVMIGEGEESFRDLLRYYCEQGKKVPNDLRTIPGLCLPGGYTAPRSLTEMDKLPFLYEDPERFRNRIIYYESSRGCPYRCSYCLSSIDRKVRLRDIDIVKQELACFLKNKVAQVKFVDRTFNCNHDHAMSIWTYILENDNGVTNFHFEISADLLGEDAIALLQKMRPGLVQLEIGVQSANPVTLQAIHRVTDLDRLERNVAAVKAGRNIHQHLDLIAGLPFEDYESFGRSFDWVYRMGPQQLQLGFLKVLKGSEMYDRAQEFGVCFRSAPPYEVLYTDWLSYGDLLKLKRIEEMVEMYYNSNQYTHTLPFLEQAFDSPFAMFEALAAHYEAQGYVTNSPARSYRYQVLLDFAVSVDSRYREVYRELLTYDMYLRENVKSRPDFAVDRTPWKERIRDFYRREENDRRYLPDYREYDARQMSKMTHLEPFVYPVWDAERMAEVRADACETVSGTPNAPGGSPDVAHSPEPDVQMVLFDYRRRDPLTYEAAVQVVET